MRYLESWLWLAHGLGYCAKNTRLILDTFTGGAQQIWQEWNDRTAWDLLTQVQIKRLCETKPTDFTAGILDAKKNGVTILSYSDPSYPQILRTTFDPPLVLYTKGDTSLLNGYLNIAIVGARKPTMYGVQAVHLIGEELASCGVVIVSGLAHGLDSEAHKSALKVGGKTIACLAFGHGKCYPASNQALMETIEKEGLLISEYPAGTAPKKNFFLQRNRLIAGLSQGLLIAEARKKSGTMNTVSMAHAADRDIFAVPGSIFSELSGGTNGWLIEGAYPATCADDILNKYGLESKVSHIKQEKRQKIEIPVVNLEQDEPTNTDAICLDGEEEDFLEVIPEDIGAQAKAIYKVLQATPLPLEAICSKSGFPVQQVMALLLELELKGVIEQLPGRKFAIKH